MLMILLACLAQCLSMGEAVLHFITSIEKDSNSSSTLSFSKCLYIYAFNHRCNLCIYLSTYHMLLGGQPSFVFVFNKCRITIICAHHFDTFWQCLLLMEKWWKLLLCFTYAMLYITWPFALNKIEFKWLNTSSFICGG